MMNDDVHTLILLKYILGYQPASDVFKEVQNQIY